MSRFVDRARELFPGRDFIGFYNDDVCIAAPGHAGEMRTLVESWGESYLPPRWKETLSADAERETRDFGPMFQREISRVSYPWTPTLRYRGVPWTSDDAGIEEAVERKLAAINSLWKQPAPAPAPEPNPFAPFRAAYERARRASLKKELRARKRERESWRDFDAAWGFERPRPLRRLVRIEHALRSPGGMVRLAIVEDLERDLLGGLTRNNAAWQRLRQQARPGIMDGGKSIIVPLNWTP